MIEREQVQIQVAASGLSNTIFDFTWKARNDKTMILDLCASLDSIACASPSGGMLVFFPSYGLMRQYIEEWKRSKYLTVTGLDKLHFAGSNKRIFFESTDNNKNKQIVKDYYA